MFQNNLYIYVISHNNNIEKILKESSIPEDSNFYIQTYSDFNDIKPDNINSDTAIIVDCFTIGSEILQNPDAGFFIILAPLNNLPEKAILDNVNALWITSENAPYDKYMLETYSKLLINAMKSAADNRKTEICFNTVIDSVPDLVWFKDAIGAHLIVNDSFCKVVEKTKQQIYKKGHYYIWDIPKSEYDQGDYVCLESEEIVIDARKTCLFDEKVKTKGGMRQFKTYKSPLIDTNGEVFGTCGFAHDITDIHNTNNELDVVLESMPYAVVVVDRHNTVISTNSKFQQYFPDETDFIGTNFDERRNKPFDGYVTHVDGSVEIHKEVDGELKHLVFTEEPINDIFHEKIGRLIIFRDITLQRNYEQETLHNANTDFLTGLHNRRSLFEYLNEIRNNAEITLITVDLDNFKKVNDNFGHHMGDEALIATSRILEECFPEDFIARLGGDEFLITIAEAYSNEELEKKTVNLLDTLCNFYKAHKEFSMVTASAGIATSVLKDSNDIHNIENLLFNSDNALYGAKKSGKSQYRFFNNI